MRLDVISYVLGMETGKKSGGGGAELNIAYGYTAPEDTTKLWVKTSKPSKVIITPNLSGNTLSDKFENANANAAFSGGRSCCASVNGELYTFGGAANNYSYPQQYIQQYYKSGNSWYRTNGFAQMPDGILDACCASVGTMIYVFGGATGKSSSSVQSTIYAFDSKAKTISTLSVSMPTTISKACCAAVGTKIYIFGGNHNNGGDGRVKTIFCFDAETTTVTTLETTLPIEIQNMCCATVGTKIYLFGGHTYDYGIVDSIYCFDTETEELTTLETTLPTVLAYACCAAIGTKIYIFGGALSLSTPTYSYSIYAFDTATNTIATSNLVLTSALYCACAATVGEQIMVVFGGEYHDYYYITGGTNAAHLFTPATQVSVDEDVLLVILNGASNVFPLVNTEAAKVEIGAGEIFKGNADGVGERVQAALYKDGAWATI